MKHSLKQAGKQAALTKYFKNLKPHSDSNNSDAGSSGASSSSYEDDE